MLPYISLGIWNIPEWWHWTCYYLTGVSAALEGLCFTYVLSAVLSLEKLLLIPLMV